MSVPPLLGQKVRVQQTIFGGVLSHRSGRGWAHFPFSYLLSYPFIFCAFPESPTPPKQWGAGPARPAACHGSPLFRVLAAASPHPLASVTEYPSKNSFAARTLFGHPFSDN